MPLILQLIVIEVCLGFLNTNTKCSGLAMKITIYSKLLKMYEKRVAKMEKICNYHP